MDRHILTVTRQVVIVMVVVEVEVMTKKSLGAMEGYEPTGDDWTDRCHSRTGSV